MCKEFPSDLLKILEKIGLSLVTMGIPKKVNNRGRSKTATSEKKCV